MLATYKHYTSRRFLSFAAGIGFAASLLLGGASLLPTVPRAVAACDSTAVVYCGLDKSSLSAEINSAKSAYSKNKDSEGRGGIQTAFNWTGLSSSVVSSMSTANTKAGTLFADGRIVVDGKTINDVSKGLWVTTRLSGEDRQNIGNGIYVRKVPGSQNNSERIIVTYNGSGVPVGAIMVDCGNSVKFVALPIVTECTGLATPTLLDRAQKRYSFIANTRAGNAALTGGSFSFGDGASGNGVVSSASLKAEHAYAKAGTYTVTATVKFSVNGYSVTKTCKTTFTIDAPAVSIKKYVNGSDASAQVQVGQSYVYSLVVKNTGTASLTNVVATDTAPTNVQFLSADPGKVTDGKTYKYVIPILEKGASVTLKITAKVKTYVDKAITNTACVNAPEVNPETPTKDDDCDPADVTVPKPIMECSRLTGPLLSGQTMGFRFTAESKTANGAVLKRALFVFGDGESRSVNATTGSSTISTDYIYAKEGKYSAFATLYFDVFGTEKAASFNCYAKVEPSKPAVPECKPGIPVGDIRCNPCEYDASIPKDDPRCIAPAATLPNTGAGNIIALASAALVGGFLWYRHILFRRHKRAYLAADFGTSPLPLAEPLESPDPLAATPLAPQPRGRFSMRRRRQY